MVLLGYFRAISYLHHNSADFEALISAYPVVINFVEYDYIFAKGLTQTLFNYIIIRVKS